MRIANGKVFDGQCFRERDVVVEGQSFSSIGASGDEAGSMGGAADTLDASGCYVIPGLIDVHFHGAMGHDFCDASDEGISAIAAYEASRGVTSICPTTMTLPEERLAPIVASVAAHEASAGEAGIVGINMEGPYIALRTYAAPPSKSSAACSSRLWASSSWWTWLPSSRATWSSSARCPMTCASP